MSEKNRDIKLSGIIIKKTEYRETSLIIDVFTARFGLIPVMAKGVRSSKSKSIGLLEILNELDLILYKNPVSDWYIFKNAELLRSHLHGVKYETAVLMQAAAEILKQLLLEKSDFEKLYELLQQYLDYIRKVPKNGIAVFWRFLLRLFRLIGIEFNVSSCVECSRKKIFTAYYPQKQGFLCPECYHPVPESYLIKLTEAEAEIFGNLLQIGNLLEDMRIDNATVARINRIFLIHLSEHFHQKFYLKSLEMLSY